MDPTSADDDYDAHIASDGESLLGDDDLKQEGNSPSSKPNGSSANASGGQGTAHMQKRRRVTRACDECRRKKIKCDGKQPCTHCTVYSYDCTYDQPSNRRRNPAPQYVESLEHRVHRAETLLHILIPNLDLNDPGIDAAVAQGWIPGAPGKGDPTATQLSHSVPTSHPVPPPQNAKNRADINLESMVRAISQLDMDEQGYWDYHGHSSGLSFVRRMREQLGDIMGPETVATPFTKSRPSSHVLDSPRSISDSPGTEVSPHSQSSDLPPKELAMQFCSHAVDEAAALLRFIHKPSFWKSFESLYNTPPDQQTNEHSQFLPLFYSSLALGHLFGKDEQGSSTQQGYESAIQRGFRYFKSARQLMDIADCRDLSSIQAVLFMILFLQSSAKLSQCYAYLGVALRSALRMGLHRAHAGKFDPIEAETRKRVFWSIRKLDIYVGAMIGLPLTLSDDEIDQDFPVEVDDEYITREGILPMPEGQVSTMTAFNCHTQLVLILAKIVHRIYPIKMHNQEASKDKSYTVPFSTIREIEGDLENWKTNLPAILSPCPAPARYSRIQQLLRLSYANAQVMLYRPFLHFTAMEKRTKPIDQRAYACAASYVNVSRNIIHITSQMKQKGLLNGPFWFTAYTTFFSILSLVYFAAENPDNPTTQAVMKDALEGKQVLSALSTRSMAADRCTATLDHVFQRLPDWMREGRQNPIATKKRTFDSTSLPQASRSHPDIAAIAHETSFTPTLGKRASTFPKHRPDTPNGEGMHSPYPASWQSGASSYGPHTPTSNGFESNSFAHFNQTSGSGNLGMRQYSNSPNFVNPALHDLSAISFPTADEPFSYPNQPLTTFENNQQAFKNISGDSTLNTALLNKFDGATSNSPMIGTPGEDNLEAQFYALPPYIEQRQQRTATYPIDGPMNYTAQQHPTSMPDVMQMSNGTSWSMTTSPQQHNLGQQDFSNIDIQDVFGGSEWNPMLMNPAGGYQGA
ncbi:Hypothetical protein R9X50_00125600 [Acrodontium crateriforme]|uniref:Zn(2)-C6 fungal-type domain-containing protein n=1 Tax=Acrodontium crateriforme TaxID=150365 RepID=A0AAQ3M265_9PEZI|nr:Hypothetical protein R9X50_00125600 [Acrodontium crateriforme]